MRGHCIYLIWLSRYVECWWHEAAHDEGLGWPASRRFLFVRHAYFFFQPSHFDSLLVFDSIHLWFFFFILFSSIFGRPPRHYSTPPFTSVCICDVVRMALVFLYFITFLWDNLIGKVRKLSIQWFELIFFWHLNMRQVKSVAILFFAWLFLVYTFLVFFYYFCVINNISVWMSLFIDWISKKRALFTWDTVFGLRCLFRFTTFSVFFFISQSYWWLRNEICIGDWS